MHVAGRIPLDSKAKEDYAPATLLGRLVCILVVLLGVGMLPASASAHPRLELQIVGSSYVQPGETVTVTGRFDRTTYEAPAVGSTITLRLGLGGVVLGRASLDESYAFTITAVAPEVQSSAYRLSVDAVDPQGQTYTLELPESEVRVLSVGLPAPAPVEPAPVEQPGVRPEPATQAQPQVVPVQPSEAQAPAAGAQPSPAAASVRAPERSAPAPRRRSTIVMRLPRSKPARRPGVRDSGAQVPEPTAGSSFARDDARAVRVRAPRSGMPAALAPATTPRQRVSSVSLGQRGVMSVEPVAALPRSLGLSGRVAGAPDLLALVAALSLLAWAWWRRDGGRAGTPLPESGGPDLVEVALQELIAEELARTPGEAAPVAPTAGGAQDAEAAREPQPISG